MNCVCDSLNCFVMCTSSVVVVRLRTGGGKLAGFEPHCSHVGLFNPDWLLPRAESAMDAREDWNQTDILPPRL